MAGYTPGPDRLPVLELIERRRSVESNGCHSLGGKRGKYPSVGGKGNRVSVTRFLLGLEVGDPRVVRHTCDNNWCINRGHLVVGTQAQNLADMVARRRSNRGSKHWNARLTDEQVQEIRADPRSSPEVAGEYGMSPRYIRKIRSGQKRRVA